MFVLLFVGKEVYDILISLVAGMFKKAKYERSQLEKAAVLTVWRAKGRFFLEEDRKVFLFDCI